MADIRTSFAQSVGPQRRFQEVFFRGVKIRSDVIYTDPETGVKYRVKSVTGAAPSVENIKGMIARGSVREDTGVKASEVSPQLEEEVSRGIMRDRQLTARVKQAKKLGVSLSELPAALGKQEQQRAEYQRLQGIARQQFIERRTPTTQAEFATSLFERQGRDLKLTTGGGAEIVTPKAAIVRPEFAGAREYPEVIISAERTKIKVEPTRMEEFAASLFKKQGKDLKLVTGGGAEVVVPSDTIVRTQFLKQKEFPKFVLSEERLSEETKKSLRMQAALESVTELPSKLKGKYDIKPTLDFSVGDETVFDTAKLKILSRKELYEKGIKVLKVGKQKYIKAEKSVGKLIQPVISKDIKPRFFAKADIKRSQGFNLDLIPNTKLKEYAAFYKELGPRTLETAGGYVGGLREKPIKTALATSAFFVLPVASKGVAALPWAGKVRAGAKIVSPAVKGLLYGTYTKFSLERMQSSKRPFGKFGEILSTEITPALVGGALGTRVASKISFKRTPKAKPSAVDVDYRLRSTSTEVKSRIFDKRYGLKSTLRNLRTKARLKQKIIDRGDGDFSFKQKSLSNVLGKLGASKRAAIRGGSPKKRLRTRGMKGKQQLARIKLRKESLRRKGELKDIIKIKGKPAEQLGLRQRIIEGYYTQPTVKQKVLLEVKKPIQITQNVLKLKSIPKQKKSLIGFDKRTTTEYITTKSLTAQKKIPSRFVTTKVTDVQKSMDKLISIRTNKPGLKGIKSGFKGVGIDIGRGKGVVLVAQKQPRLVSKVTLGKTTKSTLKRPFVPYKEKTSDLILKKKPTQYSPKELFAGNVVYKQKTPSITLSGRAQSRFRSNINKGLKDAFGKSKQKQYSYYEEPQYYGKQLPAVRRVGLPAFQTKPSRYISTVGQGGRLATGRRAGAYPAFRQDFRVRQIGMDKPRSGFRFGIGPEIAVVQASDLFSKQGRKPFQIVYPAITTQQDLGISQIQSPAQGQIPITAGAYPIPPPVRPGSTNLRPRRPRRRPPIVPIDIPGQPPPPTGGKPPKPPKLDDPPPPPPPFRISSTIQPKRRKKKKRTGVVRPFKFTASIVPAEFGKRGVTPRPLTGVSPRLLLPKAGGF